jgi:hypothetical protein
MPTPSRNDIYEAVIRKMVNQALEEQEDAFEQIHRSDPEDALVAYLQHCAEVLGYSPRYKEIVGWRLLEQRFGSWNDALHGAGLPPAVKSPVTKLPRILEETEKQKELYRQKKAEKKLRNRQRMEAQERNRKEHKDKRSASLSPGADL